MTMTFDLILQAQTLRRPDDWERDQGGNNDGTWEVKIMSMHPLLT